MQLSSNAPIPSFIFFNQQSSIINHQSQCVPHSPSFTSGGLFAIGIQVPESLLQQQKKNREIREIRAKNIRNKAAKAPTSPLTFWWDYVDLKNAYAGRLTSTFGCPNHLAGYMEMAIPLILGLFLLSHRPGKLVLLTYLTIRPINKSTI